MRKASVLPRACQNKVLRLSKPTSQNFGRKHIQSSLADPPLYGSQSETQPHHFGDCDVQVKDAVLAIDPRLVVMACGSYRRGKATCGDVDVLISHPDGKSHKGVFGKVLQTLHDSGELPSFLEPSARCCSWMKLHNLYPLYASRGCICSKTDATGQSKPGPNDSETASSH